MLTSWRKLQRAGKSEVFCVSSRTAWAQVSWCAHPDQVSTLFQPWLTLRLHRLGVGKASDHMHIRSPMLGGKVDFLVMYFFLVFHIMIALCCSLLKVLSSRLSSTLSFLHSELVHHFINLVSCWSLFITFCHCNVYTQTVMIKLQCTYWHRMVARVLLINVNFEDLLSDDVERFTAVDSTPAPACTLCCCAIVLDMNVLALPVEAHIVTNKPNQRESPLLFWENSLHFVARKNFLNEKMRPRTDTWKYVNDASLAAGVAYFEDLFCKRRACSFDRSWLSAARRYLWPVPVYEVTHACASVSIWNQTRLTVWPQPLA